MSEATLGLVTREALELHFEGHVYGPIEHTEALGVLLFALRPRRVRCVAARADVDAAMQRVLAAAGDTRSLLEALEDALADEDVRPAGLSMERLAAWVDAGCRAAPADRAPALHAELSRQFGLGRPAAATVTSRMH